MTFTKNDSGKLDLTLLPLEALEEVTKVLEFGASKYGKNNWKTASKEDRQRYLQALMRHTFSHLKGDITDDESGLYHMAHVACNALFYLHFMIDDREFNKQMTAAMKIAEEDMENLYPGKVLRKTDIYT